MVYLVTYDSCMSVSEMQASCPSAIRMMKCLLKGYRLTFRCGVLSIEPGAAADAAPAVVWEISEADESDLAELYPKELYTKIQLRLKGEGIALQAIAYVFRNTKIALPDGDDMEKIGRAYEECGFDYWYIENAADTAADWLKEEAKSHGTLHAGTDCTGKQHES